MDISSQCQKKYRENNTIPESILKAESILKSDYPELYRIVLQYRYSPNIQYHDLVKIQVHTEVAGFPWERFGKLIMRFIGPDEKKIEDDFLNNCIKTVKKVKKDRKKYFQRYHHDPGTKNPPPKSFYNRINIRLTPEQRSKIENDSRKPSIIAADYGITRQHVSWIKKRFKEKQLT